MTAALLARLDAAANRVYGWRWNPLYHSGPIAVTLLLVLLATGLYLLLYYRIGAPYASVERITDQAFAGRWIRALHRYASAGMMVAVAAHAFRMYAQRRTWGPRVLAWASGLVLLFVLLVCGWTGYVMVWDVQAQLLAVEGARFLDLLPIFSEPIGRAFVGEAPLPSAFFFLNLFLHVALPIGVGLVLWLHVARVARPALLPPRPVLWGVVAAFVVVSVAIPVGMAPEAELLRIPGRAPVDVFYSFFLPLTRPFAAAWAWLVTLLLAAVLLLVPLWTRPRTGRRPGPSIVNERACTGCEQCSLDCPFGAIEMVERADGRDTLVAQVNASLCVSCAICSASCAPMALGPAGRTGRDQLAAAKRFIAACGGVDGQVVLAGCVNAGCGRGDAFAGAPLFGVRCAGTLHTSAVEQLVRAGAAGVLVVACPPDDCRNREGPQWTGARLFEGREAELKERVDRRRVRYVHAASLDATGLERELAAFRQDLAAIEPPVTLTRACGLPRSRPAGDDGSPAARADAVRAADLGDDLDLIGLCDRDDDGIAQEVA
jgi:coenzyme F420-reducing hydrogenase delta subunit/Pyruvate/2-oxoacid:ferredoxin oxidoreductase delta subunit